MTRIHTLRSLQQESAIQTPWRRQLIGTLRRTSASLSRLAERLAQMPGRRRRRAPELEFYAEAGAPEGALYIDGQLIGKLPGITRL